MVNGMYVQKELKFTIYELPDGTEEDVIVAITNDTMPGSPMVLNGKPAADLIYAVLNKIDEATKGEA